jgi:glycosyltransferase involved in cell wall biosynthesis
MTNHLSVFMGFIFVGVLTCLFLMALLNAFTAVRLRAPIRAPKNCFGVPKKFSLSVLIPARNEALNLSRLLPALLQSSLKPDEILVLDDESEDGTFEIASRALQKGDIPYRVIAGRPVAFGLALSGKNHACAQLAQAAIGDVLLFCDADVIPSRQAIERSAYLLGRTQCAGFSALPRQITRGFRERLVMPWLVQIPLLTMLPLGFAWRTRIRSAQMANGQWLAIWRDRYEEVGGHQALGTELLDDVRLAARVANSRGYGLLPVLSVSDISVEMYTDWDEMIRGFSKNLVQIYGGNSLAFALILLVWTTVFSFPLWGFYFNPEAARVALCLVVAIRILGAWLFAAPQMDIFYYFQSLYFLMRLGFCAIRNQYYDQVQWKGRHVSL